MTLENLTIFKDVPDKSGIAPPETPFTPTFITLGRNVSFGSADCGNFGYSLTGVAPSLYGSDYSSINKYTRETVTVGPGGIGGADAWSYVGRRFSVAANNSTTSKIANIRMTGSYKGETTAYAGATSATNITMVVKDLTWGTQSTETIYTKSCSVAQTESTGLVPFDVNEMFYLKAGHVYLVCVLIEGSSAIYGAGTASSDFGPWDGDNYNEGVYLDRIYVYF